MKLIPAGYDLERRPMLIIGNASWWVENEAEIVNWCNEVNCTLLQKGMMLTFTSVKDREWFALRWQ